MTTSKPRSISDLFVLSAFMSITLEGKILVADIVRTFCFAAPTQGDSSALRVYPEKEDERPFLPRCYHCTCSAQAA